jgi:hypothetical protein
MNVKNSVQTTAAASRVFGPVRVLSHTLHRLMCMMSQAAARSSNLHGGPIAFSYIDGSHTYEQ